MSKKQVKEYSNEFKLKVVLEVLQGKNTMNEISQKYKVMLHNVKYWKHQFFENANTIFNKNKGQQELKDEIKMKNVKIDELHRQIGQVSAELEWAKKI